VFADEQITDLGLEEIEFEDENHYWRITIGFSRPWTVDNNQNVRRQMEAIAHAIKDTPPRRDYKVVTLKDETGGIVSVKNRELQTAA
jgi:hypothetical protein